MHRTCIATLVSIAGMSCLHSAAAASWPQAQLLSHAERVLQQAPVSGGYIRGLQIINEDQSHAESPVALNRLFVPLQPHDMQDLCLQVSSRDGLYLATYQYRLPPTTISTYAEIDIAATSQHQEYYHRASPRDLAVVAYSGSCNADDTPLIPVFWNSPPVEAAPRTLVVAVQSGDRDATLYWGGKDKSHAGWSCHAIGEQGVARFDSLCEQQLTGPVVSHDTLVQVEACSFGDCGIVQSAHIEP